MIWCYLCNSEFKILFNFEKHGYVCEYELTVHDGVFMKQMQTISEVAFLCFMIEAKINKYILLILHWTEYWPRLIRLMTFGWLSDKQRNKTWPYLNFNMAIGDNGNIYRLLIVTLIWMEFMFFLLDQTRK